MDEVTRILRAIEQGDHDATRALFPIVYDELRRLAAAKLAHEKPGQTLQATALVHEAFLRLAKPNPTDRGVSDGNERQADSTIAASTGKWRSRGHFFAAAAEAMRRILVEQARRRQRIKRGGDRVRVEFEVAEIAAAPTSDEIIALDEALEKLEAEHKMKAEVVKLRYFAGLSIDDTAAALGISTPTVKRYWAYARAWLLREISEGNE